jgi:hypothetical protein
MVGACQGGGGAAKMRCIFAVLVSPLPLPLPLEFVFLLLSLLLLLLGSLRSASAQSNFHVAFHVVAPVASQKIGNVLGSFFDRRRVTQAEVLQAPPVHTPMKSVHGFHIRDFARIAAFQGKTRDRGLGF